MIKIPACCIQYISICFLISVVCVGCGEEMVCAGVRASSVVGSPQITQFSLKRQEKADPWSSVFSLSFTDMDGDLAQGKLHLYLDARKEPTIKQSMSSLMLQSRVSVREREGTIGIPVRFSDQIIDGSIVRVGAQLIDGEGRWELCAINQ